MKEYEKLARVYQDMNTRNGKPIRTLMQAYESAFLKCRQMAIEAWHQSKGDCYITTRDLENLGEKEV